MDISEYFILMNNDAGEVIRAPSQSLKGNVKKMLKGYDVFNFLIPVGTYTPQYMIVKPTTIPSGFMAADVEYKFYLLPLYDNVLRFVLPEIDDIQTQKVHCDNLVQFYNVIHSIRAMEACNWFLTDISEATEESLMHLAKMAAINFKCTIKTKHGDVKYESKTPEFRYGDFEMWLCQMFDIHYFGACKTMYKIYIEKDSHRSVKYKRDAPFGHWGGQAVIGCKDIKPYPFTKINPHVRKLPYLESSLLHFFDTITLTHPEDLAILEAFMKVGTMTISYTQIQEPLDNTCGLLERRITLDDIENMVDAFYMYTENSLTLHGSRDVIEALSMVKQLMTCMKLTNNMLSADFHIKDATPIISFQLQPKVNVRFEMFDYTIIDTDDLETDDYYDDFFERLRLHCTEK